MKQRTLLDRLSRWLFKRRVDKIYRQNDYLDAYRMHTDLRAKRDPKMAVGGMWDEVGRLQLEFLLSRGPA